MLRLEPKLVQVLPDSAEQRLQDPQIGFPGDAIAPGELFILGDEERNWDEQSEASESQVGQPAVSVGIDGEQDVRAREHAVRSQSDAGREERHWEAKLFQDCGEQEVLFETVAPAP